MSTRAGDWLVLGDRVGKRFGQRWIFREQSFRLSRGTVTALTGPSGSGKTTLSRIALGLESPTEGTVSHRHGLRLSVLFPEDRLLPGITIEQNLRYVGLGAEETVGMARRLDLDEAMTLLPEELSSGMRRRAAFIRAACHKADVLLLDEPFKGLDERMRDKLAAEIEQIAENSAVLIIDHDVTLVQSIAQQTITLT